MKFSNPQFVVVETVSDVQTKRDASGEVFDIGETEMQGIVNSAPSGRRRYDNEILAYEAFVSMELGYAVSIVAKPEPELLKPVKSKPLKPKKVKAKPKAKRVLKDFGNPVNAKAPKRAKKNK